MLRAGALAIHGMANRSTSVPGVDRHARITFRRAELITFLGGVFHYPTFIPTQKRQSRGKFVTPSQNLHQASAPFARNFNELGQKMPRVVRVIAALRHFPIRNLSPSLVLVQAPAHAAAKKSTLPGRYADA
jgi:hypothetical protein